MPALRDAFAGPALALAFLLPFQVQIPSPAPISGVQRDLPLVRIEDMYGPLQVEDLDRIAHDGGSYHRRLVLTRGVLSDLVPGRFLVLEQGTARVLLLPFESVNYHDYISLRGVDVDLTGVVRVLPAKQKSVLCRGTYVLESKCEDWDLPVLPDAQIQWPPVSITIVKMSDRGTSGGPRRSGPRAWPTPGWRRPPPKASPCARSASSAAPTSAVTCPPRAGATSRTGCS